MTQMTQIQDAPEGSYPCNLWIDAALAHITAGVSI